MKGASDPVLPSINTRKKDSESVMPATSGTRSETIVLAVVPGPPAHEPLAVCAAMGVAVRNALVVGILAGQETVLVCGSLRSSLLREIDRRVVYAGNNAGSDCQADHKEHKAGKRGAILWDSGHAGVIPRAGCRHRYSPCPRCRCSCSRPGRTP